MLQNADFSPKTIKELIVQGERIQKKSWYNVIVSSMIMIMINKLSC
jgi:hypothetical protein